MVINKKILVLVLIITFVLLNVSVFATDVELYTYVEGNNPRITGYTSIKFDPPEDNKLYSDSAWVESTFSNDMKSVSFKSNYLVYYVFVKAGNGGNLYHYSSGVYSDDNLISPNNNGGQQADISHVTFFIVAPMVEEDPIIEDPIEDPIIEDPIIEDPIIEDPVIEDFVIIEYIPIEIEEIQQIEEIQETEYIEEVEYIEDEEIPESEIETDIYLDEEQIPFGSLPQTGEIPPSMFYGMGTLFTVIGMGIRKRLQKK